MCVSRARVFVAIAFAFVLARLRIDRSLARAHTGLSGFRTKIERALARVLSIRIFGWEVVVVARRSGCVCLCVCESSRGVCGGPHFRSDSGWVCVAVFSLGICVWF